MTIVVETEEQAWDLLRQILDGERDVTHADVVEFGAWVSLKIHLPGTPVHSSITPSMMEGFIDIQRTIYRAYTLVASDTADLRTLSKTERDALEFRVVVSEGSSDYLAALMEAIGKIGVEALSKMTPEQMLIAILAIALIIGGSYAWKQWLSHRLAMRQAEATSEERKLQVQEQSNLLTAQGLIAQAGVDHAQILARALERSPVAADVEAFAESSRSSLIRAIGEEGGGDINGVGVTREAAFEVTRQTRQAGEPIQVSGNFRVIRIDANTADGFRVTLSNVETGEEISAMLQDVFLSREHREIITEAEWGKTPFYAEVTARKVRDRLVDATVVVARRMAVPPPA